jgi:hypothetical protein
MTKKTYTAAAKARVDHTKYGPGTVVEVNARYTTIAFDESGTRKFVSDIVRLAPSDTPAPPTRTRKTPVRRAGKKSAPRSATKKKSEARESSE